MNILDLSLGGWVATRASGMKKNRYGNIEDIVVSLRAVTPNGEWRSSGTYPRVSTGPDMNHVMLGSEGIMPYNERKINISFLMFALQAH